MLRKKTLVLFLTSIVLSLMFSSFLTAQENETLRMNLMTIVYSVTPHVNMPEVKFSIYNPIITEDSIPIYAKLSEESKYNSQVTGFDYKTIKDDRSLIRFTLKNLVANVKSYIAVEFFTLKRMSFYEDLPALVSIAPYRNLSVDLKYFTQGSSTVQSTDPKIRAKAYEFFYQSWGGRNIIDILQDIFRFTGEEIAFEGSGSQTALETLRRG